MIPDWAKTLAWNIINDNAKAYGIDSDLIAAIIMQETSGKPFVTRFEQSYKYLVNPAAFAQLRNISEITEVTHQKTSWGLMQIMGGVAREAGYKADLPELTRPTIGMRWGCMKLKSLVDKYGMLNVADILASWNAGSPQKDPSGNYINQKYVVAALRYYNQLQGVQS